MTFLTEDGEKWRHEAKCMLPDPSIDELRDELRARGFDEETISTRTTPSEIFFPIRDREMYPPVADHAKAICNGKDRRAECPVRMQCLLYALDQHERHGIFGGQSHRERNALQRKADQSGDTVREYLGVPEDEEEED